MFESRENPSLIVEELIPVFGQCFLERRNISSFCILYFVFCIYFITVHPDKSCYIPELIEEYLIILDDITTESEIISWRIPDNEGETKCVSRVFLYQFEWINTISE